MSKRRRLSTSNIEHEWLPNDLVIQILECLPVRSLSRFKSVSKWWNSTITDPNFVNRHRITRGKDARMLLLRRCLPCPQSETVFSFHNLDSPELDEIQPNVPISFLDMFSSPLRDDFCLLGTCNGIVCITYRSTVILCNPALRQFKRLPPCPVDCPVGYDESLLSQGFGVTVSGEFKVILTWIIESEGHEDLLPGNPTYLYSSSTDSWKQISDPPAVPNPCYLSDVVFFNGACHWTAVPLNDSDPMTILSFDMNTEVFGQLELPHCLSTGEDVETRPIVVNDCLALVKHAHWYTRSEVVEVWVMEEEYGVKTSWKLKNIVWPKVVVFPIGSWRNGDWLLAQTSHGRLASVCVNEFEMEYKFYGDELKSMWAMIYEESLVSLL